MNFPMYCEGILASLITPRLRQGTFVLIFKYFFLLQSPTDIRRVPVFFTVAPTRDHSKNIYCATIVTRPLWRGHSQHNQPSTFVQHTGNPFYITNRMLARLLWTRNAHRWRTLSKFKAELD